MGDFVSGDFRREGMGAPGIGDSPPQLTASRPVPSSQGSRCTNLRDFFGQRRRSEQVSGMRYPERNRPAGSFSLQTRGEAVPLLMHGSGKRESVHGKGSGG